MKKFTLLLLTLVSFTSFSQEIKEAIPTASRHKLNITFGFGGSEAQSMHLGYEYHYFARLDSRWRLGVSSQLSYVNFASRGFFADDFASLGIRGLFLFDLSRYHGHYFEIQAGGMVGTQTEDGVGFALPSLGAGYRYHSSESSFGFRIGMGFPELIYAGVVVNLD